MSRRIAISDIHGCAKTFRFLCEKMLKLQSGDHLYLLGDYVDRGPDSKGVIDAIWDFEEQGIHISTLMGNHEEMLLRSKEDSLFDQQWKAFGGEATLESFGVRSVEEIPEQYLQFIKNLDHYIQLEKYLLVHAGFNFEAADPFGDHNSMLWIRQFEVDVKHTEGRTVVHGHTPTSLAMIQAAVNDKSCSKLCIDGGCVYSNRAQYQVGILVALDLDERKIISCLNRD